MGTDVKVKYLFTSMLVEVEECQLPNAQVGDPEGVFCAYVSAHGPFGMLCTDTQSSWMLAASHTPISCDGGDCGSGGSPCHTFHTKKNVLQ